MIIIIIIITISKFSNLIGHELVISNRPHVISELLARLLPELYDRKSNYQLIITITKFEKNMTVL